MHQAVLDRSNTAGLIDCDRVMIDGSHVRAKRGRRDRTQPGKPRQNRLQTPPVTCGNGFPLVVELSAANVNDHRLLRAVLDGLRPLRGRPGPPRRRIKTLLGDNGYDYPSVYAELRQRGITGYIPRRGTRDKVTAGRWIVE